MCPERTEVQIRGNQLLSQRRWGTDKLIIPADRTISISKNRNKTKTPYVLIMFLVHKNNGNNGKFHSLNGSTCTLPSALVLTDIKSRLGMQKYFSYR